MRDAITIGGACGFWGEATHATQQLLTAPKLDFLIYDYLAEITMSIMARMRKKDPELGFAQDFISQAMAPNLERIASRGVRVISNAGGLNPLACAQMLESALADAGVKLRVAVVTGDDLVERAAEFADMREMFSGETMPGADKILSMNAYLGAFPIAAALDASADIVITGRCVDSALTMGACVHHFGLGHTDYTPLATAALAGHIIECGPQATGGNFTDWHLAGDLAKIGYPLATVHRDNTIDITKPPDTSGIVSVGSVGEQMLYEIGDPQQYLLPDVRADFSEVTIAQLDPDCVKLANAIGRAPTGKLKVSTTYKDGYRAGYVFNFNGINASKKAEVFAETGNARAHEKLTPLKLGPYDDNCIEISGHSSGEGADTYQEVQLKTAVRHAKAEAVQIFLNEVIGSALAAPPGLSGFTGAGRPKPSPVIRLFSFLVDQKDVPVEIQFGGKQIQMDVPETSSEFEERPSHLPPETGQDRADINVPLERLAFARSGDKGDAANIGVIARRPEYLPWIWQGLTTKQILKTFAGLVAGEVQRFYLPGMHSMNILMHAALGGGGIASLRNDPQAKGFAQKLLSLPIAIPKGILIESKNDAI
jgi:hypothetical protein